MTSSENENERPEPSSSEGPCAEESKDEPEPNFASENQVVSEVKELGANSTETSNASAEEVHDLIQAEEDTGNASEDDQEHATPALDAPFQLFAPALVPVEQRIGYVVFTVIALIAIPSTAPLLFLGWIAVCCVVSGWLALIAMFVFLAHFWPPIRYRHARWRLSDVGVEIRRGVFWKHRIAIPIARVQHVDVSQGPIQRLFGLGTLTVHTAGTKNSAIVLEGLEHEKAMKLRDELIAQKETLDVT
ncbi:MAG: PH domain-containing protein [Planctomycetota bacterium]